MSHFSWDCTVLDQDWLHYCWHLEMFEVLTLQVSLLSQIQNTCLFCLPILLSPLYRGGKVKLSRWSKNMFKHIFYYLWQGSANLGSWAKLSLQPIFLYAPVSNNDFYILRDLKKDYAVTEASYGTQNLKYLLFGLL